MSRHRIPAWMLRQSVTVTPYLGSSAYGDIFGDPYTLRCRIEPRNELVRDRDGNETVASGRLFTVPDAAISVIDTVAWEGREYDVIDVLHHAGPNGKTHHVEAVLR